METVACNLCGSTRSTPVYTMPDRRYPSDERFTVVECDECGLGFVNPRPAFSEMQRYYPSQYYEEEFENNPIHHRRRYAREARYLHDLEKKDGCLRLLDVGCANGSFPRFMSRRGWDVEGVEVSASTRSIRDFQLYSQPFPEIPVDDPTYDAVTAWAVLEHVHDPMGYLQKAYRVVKPEGLFVFLVTNFESLASRHLFSEDVPRHLYFFTESTVRKYLEATGFRLERMHYGRDVYGMPPANWLPYFLQRRLRRRNFAYEDLLPSRPEFLRRNGLRPGLLSTLKFTACYPAKVLDRALWPVIETVQTIWRTYGICTYVARKP
ncbi:MAG TPA: class I SAM-dependent methyltransferase [Terriglobia bacterium]|nr:class I SAM-dependent methyltransferase [Terriglobia bacterium]